MATGTCDIINWLAAEFSLEHQTIIIFIAGEPKHGKIGRKVLSVAAIVELDIVLVYNAYNACINEQTMAVHPCATIFICMVH